MGAIMAIGVASANSILLVTFAREQQLAGARAFDAAISASRTRIRPVPMTAAARANKAVQRSMQTQALSP
jgi:multidrug efflux pump subunit AcrB